MTKDNLSNWLSMKMSALTTQSWLQLKAKQFDILVQFSTFTGDKCIVSITYFWNIQNWELFYY